MKRSRASGVTAELYKGSVNLANVSGNTIIVNTNELNAGKYRLFSPFLNLLNVL